MGQGYLVDSNTVIDLLMLRIPDSGIKLLYSVKPAISIITRIELFCKADIEAIELDRLYQFVPKAIIYQITEEIALATIDIRIKYKIKLPDAIIAATALNQDLTLVTRNAKDFEKVKELKLINPYTL